MKLIRGLGILEERENARRLYKQYLRQIDVAVVLDHYGARNQSLEGDEIVHSCLLDGVDPHHANGDENPSALANVESKLYLCRTYSTWPGGDILQFILRMENKTHLADIMPLLSELVGEASSERQLSFADELKNVFADATPKRESYPVYSDRVLKGWANMHPFLADRGISLEAASRLQIGYDPVAVRVTFPHWTPDGKLVGWQKRCLTDPRWPRTPPNPETGRIEKYKNSKGFPKFSTLYNLQRVIERGKEELIVVESPMSVAMAETLMLDDRDPLAGVVATFGAKMPEEQVALLRPFAKLTIFMDDDPAGQLAARRLTEALYRHTVVEVVPAEKGKDLGDYRDRDQLMDVISRARSGYMAMAEWKATDERTPGRQSVPYGRASVPRARTGTARVAHRHHRSS